MKFHPLEVRCMSRVHLGAFSAGCRLIKELPLVCFTHHFSVVGLGNPGWIAWAATHRVSTLATHVAGCFHYGNFLCITKHYDC